MVSFLTLIRHTKVVPDDVKIMVDVILNPMMAAHVPFVDVDKGEKSCDVGSLKSS